MSYLRNSCGMPVLPFLIISEFQITAVLKKKDLLNLIWEKRKERVKQNREKGVSHPLHQHDGWSDKHCAVWLSVRPFVMHISGERETILWLFFLWNAVNTSWPKYDIKIYVQHIFSEYFCIPVNNKYKYLICFSHRVGPFVQPMPVLTDQPLCAQKLMRQWFPFR